MHIPSQRIVFGDAHLTNFGVFATPERKLVFDINDFDETLPGPWEWDLKRLAASAVVAGRDNGYGEKTNRLMVIALVRTYADSMAHLARTRTLDVWYYGLRAWAARQDRERKHAHSDEVEAPEFDNT